MIEISEEETFLIRAPPWYAKCAVGYDRASLPFWASLPAQASLSVITASLLSPRPKCQAYKAKAREMSFNLRVGKNDPLRERLLTGSLLPSELVGVWFAHARCGAPMGRVR